jgi:hypothetical protein
MLTQRSSFPQSTANYSYGDKFTSRLRRSILYALHAPVVRILLWPSGNATGRQRCPANVYLNKILCPEDATRASENQTVMLTGHKLNVLFGIEAVLSVFIIYAMTTDFQYVQLWFSAQIRVGINIPKLFLCNWR